MISFNNLGNLGRLANQMFQYAAIKGIASNRGFEFCFKTYFVASLSSPPDNSCNLFNASAYELNLNL